MGKRRRFRNRGRRLAAVKATKKLIRKWRRDNPQAYAWDRHAEMRNLLEAVLKHGRAE